MPCGIRDSLVAWSFLRCCIALLFPSPAVGQRFCETDSEDRHQLSGARLSSRRETAVAADPYDTPEKAKIFSVDFAAHGLLPIFFVVTNDGDQPVSIANMVVKLITANHSKLTPVTTDDLYRRLSQSAVQHSPQPDSSSSQGEGRN